MLADLIVWSAVFGAFAFIFVHFHPRLSFLECLCMAPAFGLCVSAWIIFGVKSLPNAAPGFAQNTLVLSLAFQVKIVPPFPHTRNMGRVLNTFACTTPKTYTKKQVPDCNQPPLPNETNIRSHKQKNFDVRYGHSLSCLLDTYPR
jgi:hypothetical protein